MKTVYIRLETVERVKKFINLIAGYDYEFELLAGKYVVDAKSIMGILSLDLSEKFELRIHTDDDGIIEALHDYLAAD